VRLGDELHRSMVRQAVILNKNAGLYERPTRRIMVEVLKALECALGLVRKCKRSGMLKRVMTITTRLRRQSEGDFHSRHNPEQTLEDNSKMRTRSSTHPKLLVPPPFQRSAVPRSLARKLSA
jgi:hypothetical protein